MLPSIRIRERIYKYIEKPFGWFIRFVTSDIREQFFKVLVAILFIVFLVSQWKI